MLYYFLSNSILKIYSYLQGLFKSEFTKPDLFLYQQRIFNGSITDKSRNHIRVHTSKLRPGNLIRRSLAISLLKDYYERLKPLHLTSRQATTGRVDYIHSLPWWIDLADRMSTKVKTINNYFGERCGRCITNIRVFKELQIIPDQYCFSDALYVCLIN